MDTEIVIVIVIVIVTVMCPLNFSSPPLKKSSQPEYVLMLQASNRENTSDWT